MSTITRLFLTTGGAATTTGNAGAAGLSSAITSSQTAPIAANYVLGDSTIISPTVGLGAAGAAPGVSTVTLVLHVANLPANQTGRIVLWEVYAGLSSTAPAAVTSAVPVHVEHIEGGFGQQPYPTNADGTETCAGAASGAGGGPQAGNQDFVVRIPWYDVPDAQFGAGTASATPTSGAWYAVQFISKNGVVASPGLKYEAWLEF